MADDAVYLVSESHLTALRGASIASLAPLIDGTRDVDELAVASGLPVGTTARLVTQLTTAGFLSRTPVRPRSAEAAYWELADVDSDQATGRIHSCAVRVETVGELDSTAVHQALGTAGLRTDARTTPALLVVACDDYLNPALADIDSAQRAAGRPWLLFKPSGVSAWIGPVFHPVDGPCWTCLAHRLRYNRPAEVGLGHALGRGGPVPCPPTGHPAGLVAAAHLAALEAAKWLAGYRYRGQDSVCIIDSLTLVTHRHPVAHRPQCPACGDPALVSTRVRAPLVLSPRPLPLRDPSERRSATAQQILNTYGHLIDPVTGLVREITPDPRGPEFLHCYRAGQNRLLDTTIPAPPAAHRSWNSGKGTTALNAEVSALCEALERYSGSCQGDEPRIRGSYHDLQPRCLHPNAVQLFHERQFAERHRSNATCSPSHRVCDPLDEDAPIDWTPVWSLTRQEQRLLPTALLYYQVPQPVGKRFCWATSNGSAAGARVEDAVLHGFLELVERDAVAIWWYNRTRQPAFDLTACPDPWVAELLSLHRDLHREVWVLDLTTDLDVPVLAALSRRTDKRSQDIVLGFGAHLDPMVALRRALTELNQMLSPVAMVGADGSGYPRADAETLRWWQTSTVDNQPYLRPAAELRTREPADHRYQPCADLREDIRTIEELVRRHGLELLVLDQTRPDVALPVVKVIVPGLRPFWARYAPGRLYDVPVNLGRLTAPTAYEDLNPIPLFL